MIKSQKGITLTSLTIYITIVLVVVGILAVIRANLQGNIKEIYAEGTNNSEIDKFNVYFLKEVKKQGNAINIISGNEVLFTTGNKYTFNSIDNCIYLNNDIKIAENIEKCEFDQEQENGKSIIKVKIKTIIGEEKLIDYVLSSKEISFNYEDENDYIYNNYTELEYIETTGTQYIDTEYLANNTTKFETKIKLDTIPTDIVALFGGRTSTYENSYAIWLNVNDYMRWDYTALSTNQTSNGKLVVGDNLIIKDGEKNYLNNVKLANNSEATFDCTYTSFLFGINTSGTFSNGSSVKMYYTQIYDSNNLVRDYIPVIDKNNVVCLYDRVERKYYYNKGTGNFIAGPEKINSNI